MYGYPDSERASWCLWFSLTGRQGHWTYSTKLHHLRCIQKRLCHVFSYSHTSLGWFPSCKNTPMVTSFTHTSSGFHSNNWIFIVHNPTTSTPVVAGSPRLSCLAADSKLPKELCNEATNRLNACFPVSSRGWVKQQPTMGEWRCFKNEHKVTWFFALPMTILLRDQATAKMFVSQLPICW